MTTAVIESPKETALVEFVPFGAQDKVKLSAAIVQNLIAVKTKSGKTCTTQDAIKFIAMCQARRLNPFEGDAFLIGYDSKDGPTFTLITAHQAFLKRAELNSEYDGMKSGIIVKEGDELRDLEGDFYTDGQTVVGGWATVYFKNRKQPMHKRVRLKTFQKQWGIWQENPAGMICKCAEADALRSSFPTMLGGLYLKEELEPKTVDIPSTPIFSTPAPIVEAPTPEPEKAKPAAQTTPKGESDPEPDQVSDNLMMLKGLRKRLATQKIGEGALLGLLKGTGSIDEDTNSLEEVALSNWSVILMVNDQFDDIVKRILET